jgi:hypothetical protein
MTEEIGLIVRTKVVGQKGAMDKLKNDTARSVSEGAKKGMSSSMPGPLQKFSGAGGSTGNPVLDLKKLQDNRATVNAYAQMEGLKKKYGTSDLSKIMQAQTSEVAEATRTKSEGFGSVLAKGTDVDKMGNTFKDLGKSLGAMVNPNISAGEGGSGGGGGGMGKGAGVAMMVLAIMEIGKMIWGAVEKVWNAIVEATPMLQGVLKMIYKAIQFALLPIGMLIARLLYPMAKAMLESTYDLLQNGNGEMDFSSMTSTIARSIVAVIEPMAGMLGELIARMAPAFLAGLMVGIAILAAKFFKWIGECIYNALVFLGTAFYVVFTKGGEYLYNQLISCLTDLGNVLRGLGEWMWNVITGALSTLYDVLAGFVGWIWRTITGGLSYLYSKLVEFPGWIWGKITDGLSYLYTKLVEFPAWIYGKLTDGLSYLYTKLTEFPSWIYETITDGLSNIGTGLASIGGDIYNAIWSKISGIGAEGYKALHNAIASIPNGIRDIDLGWPIGKPFTGIPYIPMLETGGDVQGTGVAIVHKGETVLNAKTTESLKNRGGGGITININGPVFGVDDLNRKIKEAINAYGTAVRWA